MAKANSALVLAVLACFQVHSAHAQNSHSAGMAAEYSQGESLVRAHQWDEGIAVLLPLLKQQPRNLKALNLAALAYLGKNDPKEASLYFKRALAVDPAFFPALKNLGITEYNSHEYPEAEKHLVAAQKSQPNDPIVNLYLGETYFELHTYQQAADSLSRTGEALSRDPGAGADLAISYLQTGKKQEALELLDHLDPAQLTPKSQFALGIALVQFDLAAKSIPYLQAVSQSYPDSYDAGFDLAVGLTMARDFASAITVATGLIQKSHETAELDNVLAEAYEGNKQTQNAVDSYRRAIALDPNDDQNYLDFATLCMDHKSVDQGLTVVGVGLDARPRSERLLFMRGVLYAMQDRFDLAEKDFQAAATMAPKNSLGYVGLGVTYIETGNAKQAAGILRQKLRDKPDDASLLYLLGEALLKSGANPGDKDYTEARTSLEKSVHLNPGLCLPHVSLGTIYLAEDKLPEAVTQFEAARQLDPSETSAYSHLAVTYRRLGQTDKSREVLASLKELLDRQRSGNHEKTQALSESSSAFPAK